MVLRLAIVLLLLSGCATTAATPAAPKSFYADWIAIANPQQLCAGADSCVKHAQYRGKPLCTLVTAEKDVSTAQVGALMNQCLR
jgi:hypothetical protein